MKISKSKKMFYTCLMLVLSLITFVNKVSAEIVIYSEVVDKKEIEGWKEIKPVKIVEIYKGNQNILDKIVENK